MADGFTHLDVASALSAHYGTATPEDLVAAAAAAGATSAALTDRDGLYGAVRHIRACLAAGLRPIVGVSVQIAASSGGHGGAIEVATRGDALQAPSPAEVGVLAHGHDGGAGWAGTSRLISAAHHPPRALRRVLPHGSANRGAILDPARFSAFLLGPDGRPTATVLLGPDSDVGRALVVGDASEARVRLDGWTRRLPGGVAVEVVCHHTRPGTPRSLAHAAATWQLAVAAGVPAVLTNQVRYLRPDDAVTGDVLDAAAQLLPLGRAVAQPNAQAWLKPPARMRQLARRIADYAGFGVVEADRLCAATEELAERCVLDPVGDIGWRRPKVPELEALGLQGDPQAILAGRARAAIAWRYPDAPSGTRRAVEDRLEAELRVIAGFGFAGYFLTVADVADLIRGMGVRVQARGSGAGSLVNYLLRISSVDPLVHGLLFERFCGVARTTLPDIDLDVEAARRHDVDRAVVARYGEHRVALLAMQNRYRARGAARDAGLALGWDEERIGRLAGSLWRLNASDIRDALDDHPELAELSERIGGDPSLDLLVDLAGRLDRLPRHVSMHPCGVLLSDAGLLSLTPVQPSGAGVHMSQFDKDDIDDLGLLKLDILGVRMQSSLAYAHAEIVRVHGTRAALAGGLPPDAPYVAPDGRIDLDGLPRDDPATFTLIRSAHTLGVFQIESPGQRELVGKMQPDQFEDLIADISLFRPGPMKADMVNPFIERKLGLVPVRYPHPRLAPILAGTYGVVIYHEQVLRILHECMGVGLAQADELRRAMGDDMAAVEAAFRTRTAARRDEAGERVFSGADIDRIWTVLEGFGSFGFCKAHAAAFAWTTYQTAWLKAHYPAEFLAGILEHDPGMYPRRLLMTEARRLGVPLLPIDVNVSTDHYVVEQDVAGLGIRLSLRDVHGITGVEIRRILDRRPYHAISDFYLRAAPSRALVTRLAAIGALDSLALHEHGIVPCRDLDGPPRTAHTRGDVIAYVRRLVAAKHRPSAREDAPPLPVFVDDAPLMPSGTPDPTPLEQTAADLDATSAELHDHIIEGYRPLLEEVGVIPAAALLDLRSDTRVFVAGIRVATQTPPMKSGKRVVFLSLDDGSGVADCAFFTEAQARSGPVLFGVPLLLVQGRTRRTGARGISVQAEQAWDLKRMWADWSRRLAA